MVTYYDCYLSVLPVNIMPPQDSYFYPAMATAPHLVLDSSAAASYIIHFPESLRRRRCRAISTQRKHSVFVLQTRRKLCCAVASASKTASPAKTKSGAGALVGVSQGRDEDVERLVCPGCGIYLQESNPEAPGYFTRPKTESSAEAEPQLDNNLKPIIHETLQDEDSEEEEEEEDSLELQSHPHVDDKDLLGFGPAGPGFGDVTEEDFRKRKKKLDKDEKKSAESAEQEVKEPIVCSRCYSLRHYGRIKDWDAENLIPDFDFEKTVGNRLLKASRLSSRTVLVLVVDAVDFDGSFPRRAADFITHNATETVGNDAVIENLRAVLVATKVDLLPQQISPARLDQWVRGRARANGAPKLEGVFLVSSHKDLGVRNLVARIKELAGPRGNVWVVGAQNAGKSTLINLIGKKERGKVAHLTEAPVPGTTLGILRITGILPDKARLYDTPGMVHPYQVNTKLNRDEQKMVEIRKEIKPRTYRVKVGQCVHIGALVRVDLNQSTVETIYLTVFASVHVPLHMGKIEKANEIKENHFGKLLQPPIDDRRVSMLGEWKQREIKVSGKSWDCNSLDVTVAGLGWLSVGINGDASLLVWTYDGVDITVREPLVLDRAPFLEKPGFPQTKAAKAKNQLMKSKEKDSHRKKVSRSRQSSIDDLSKEILQLN